MRVVFIMNRVDGAVQFTKFCTATTPFRRIYMFDDSTLEEDGVNA